MAAHFSGSDCPFPLGYFLPFVSQAQEETASDASTDPQDNTDGTKKSRVDEISRESLTLAGSISSNSQSSKSPSWQLKWVAKLHRAGEKTLAKIYQQSLSKRCELTPLKTKSTHVVMTNNIRMFTQKLVLDNIMEFVGDVQPFAAVNREWRNKIHRLTFPFIPKIVSHINWVNKFFEDRSDAEGNFRLDDLFIRTIRALTENYTSNIKSILDKLDKWLGNMLLVEDYFKNIPADQPSLMKLVIKVRCSLFEFAPDTIKSDVAFVKELVQIKGTCIKHAAPPLKAHREVILLAVQQDPSAYEFIDEALQEDDEVIKLVFPKQGSMFCVAPENVQKNREYLKLALTMNGGFGALQSALLLDIWNDDELVNLALMNDRTDETPILNDPELPEDRRTDKDFSLKVCIQNPEEFEYTQIEFRSDFDFCKTFFLEHPRYFTELELKDTLETCIPKDVVKRLWEDKEVTLAIIQCDPFPNFREPKYEDWLRMWGKDRDVIEAACIHLTNEEDDMQSRGEALKYADKSLMVDKVFIQKILSQVGLALQWIPDPIRLSYDVEVFESALKNNPDAAKWVPQQMFDTHPQLCDLALQGYTDFWLRSSLKSKQEDLAIAKVAINRNFRVFKLFPAIFKERAEFVEIAVKRDVNMLLVASADWREDYWKFRQVLSWNHKAIHFALPSTHSYHYFKRAAIIRYDLHNTSADTRIPYFQRMEGYYRDIKSYRSSGFIRESSEERKYE